ncbi:MAG: hypothetical protein P1U53_04635 [Sulfitobacter sp.]|nr:hypothetical protein [Sulfitobacter sp.]
MTETQHTPRPPVDPQSQRSTPVTFIAQCLAALVRDGGAMEARIETQKGRF